MAEPFIGEIRMFAFSFVPPGWAQCNGQVLPIAQNTALFSIVGQYYEGGDYKTTFALPDLAGRVPLGYGWAWAEGLSEYFVGESGGSQTVTLRAGDMPKHTHAMMASVQNANQLAPTKARTLAASAGGYAYQGNTTVNLTKMNANALGNAGGGVAHNNCQPSLVLNLCIALQGEFPPRPEPPQRAPEPQPSD